MIFGIKESPKQMKISVKRRIVPGLILALVMVLFMTTALAKTTVMYITSPNGASVNMRSGPSKDHRVVMTLEEGTRVSMVSEEGEWAKIQLDKEEGYVMKSYLSSEDPTSDDDLTGKTLFVKSPNSMPVNMRSGAGKDNSPVGQLVTGTEVTVLSRNGDWTEIKVKSTGDTGFIMTDYLVKQNPYAPGTGTTTAYIVSENGGDINIRSQSDSGSPVVVKVPSGTPATVLNTGSVWTKVTVDGGTGFVLTEFVTNTLPKGDGADDGKKTKIMFVKSPNSMPVNMRAARGRGEKVIAELVTGTAVEVLSQDANWSEVSVNGKTGYIMNTYLVTNMPGDVDPSAAYTAYVTTPNHGTVRVRYGAGAGYGVVTTLEEGTKVKVISTVQGWARVSVDKIEGYINLDYLTTQKP